MPDVHSVPDVLTVVGHPCYAGVENIVGVLAVAGVPASVGVLAPLLEPLLQCRSPVPPDIPASAGSPCFTLK